MSTPGEGQREARIEGVAFLDGDAFCAVNGERGETPCEGQRSYVFVPECEHESADEMASPNDLRATLIIHNAGASVAEPASHNSAEGGEAPGAAQDAASIPVASGASASAGAPVRAGADVEGPSEPAESLLSWIDMMSTLPAHPLAAPATQEAPSGRIESLPMTEENYNAVGVLLKSWGLVGVPEADAMALRRSPSTSPSAPAEPLREQVRRSLDDVLSLVKQGPGGRNVWLLPYEAEALRAALSVSTSAPKETSEPRGNCTLVIDRERWQIGPGSMSAGDLRERFKLPSYGDVDLWEEIPGGDDRRLMNHHVIQLPAGAVVRLYTGARFITNG